MTYETQRTYEKVELKQVASKILARESWTSQRGLLVGRDTGHGYRVTFKGRLLLTINTATNAITYVNHHFLRYATVNKFWHVISGMHLEYAV